MPSLTQSDFESHIGAKFNIDVDNGNKLELVLSEVSAMGSPKKSPDSSFREQAFSVIFCGPNEPILAQQICRLENSAMGELEIFLVPIGPYKDGMGYEAVFT